MLSCTQIIFIYIHCLKLGDKEDKTICEILDRLRIGKTTKSNDKII